MKNVLLLFTILCCSFSAFSQCMPDDTLPDDFIGISPLADSTMPCDTLVPAEIAQLEQPYSTTITVFIPAEVGGFALNDVEVLSIEGLPDGLSFQCNPTDCIFDAGVPGCVEITGTVAAGVDVGLYDLLITANVDAGFLAGEVRFPLPDDPDDYTVIENTLGGAGFSFPECPYQVRVEDGSSNQDLFETQISIGQNTPNPFSGETSIPVSAKNGNYTFSVFNSVGKMVHTEDLRLAGQMNVTFDSANYDAGVYFYTFSNAEGSITKRMIIK